MNVKKKSAKIVPDGRNGSCFVLMPFGLPYDRYYENIFVPAITSVELAPVRADSLFRSSPIMGDIWKFVRGAKVLLADLSGKNPNVFYELGLSHAIGKPVILVSNTIEDVPFDLRGLRVILYDKDNESWGVDLKVRIRRALQETLADLKSAIPPMFLETGHISRPVADPQGKEIRELLAELRALRSEIKQPGADVLTPWARHILTYPQGQWTTVNTRVLEEEFEDEKRKEVMPDMTQEPEKKK